MWVVWFARAIAKQLDEADLAIIDKRRPQPNMAKVMNIIGAVKGKTCIIVDDMVDTAGTLCQAAEALKERVRKGCLPIVPTRYCRVRRLKTWKTRPWMKWW